MEAEPAGDVLESHGKFPPVVVVVRVGLGRRQFLMTMGACGVLPTLVLPFIADRGQSGEGTPDVAVTTGEERDVVRWGRRDVSFTPAAFTVSKAVPNRVTIEVCVTCASHLFSNTARPHAVMHLGTAACLGLIVVGVEVTHIATLEPACTVAHKMRVERASLA